MKAKEKAVAHLKYCIDLLSKDEDIVKEAIDIALEEQAKEIFDKILYIYDDCKKFGDLKKTLRELSKKYGVER